MSDNEIEKNTEIETDRGIPSVSQNTDYTKIWAGIFLLFGAIAIVFVIMDGMKQSEPKQMTEAGEEIFKTYAGNAEPYIEDTLPPEEELEQPTPEIMPAIPDTSQYELMMQQEALRIAREKAAERKRRMAAPQLIFDEKSNSAVNNQGVTTGGNNGGSLTGPSDANIAFAQRYGNAGVETAGASQLQNLENLITQGTMINGILETAIHSDLPGMVRAIVSKNIYSFEGSNLLIPKGSKLIGRYNSGLVRGQSRVFIIWNRLIRPDGVSIDIGSYGTDSLGRSGLAGHLDTHFFERFGSSVLLSLIDGAIQIGVNQTDDDETANVALDTGGDFSRAAEIALENSIAIKPTVNIHQGTQIQIFVGKDLSFHQISQSQY